MEDESVNISAARRYTANRSISSIVEHPMRGLIAALAGLLLAACAARSEASEADVAFVNGMWWNGAEFRRRDVYVRDGVIVPPTHAPPAAQVDLRGAYVLAGLGEAHHHRICDAPGTRRFLAAGVVYVAILNARTTSPACTTDDAAGLEVVNALAGLTAHGAHPSEIGRYFLAEDHGTRGMSCRAAS